MLGEIEAQAEKSEGRGVGAGNGFDEETSELAILEKEIVGPLEGGLELGYSADGIGGGEGGEKGKDGEVGGGNFKQKRDPKTVGAS